MDFLCVWVADRGRLVRPLFVYGKEKMLWLEKVPMEDCCQQCGAVTFDTCEKCGNCESCGHNCSDNRHAAHFALRRRKAGEDITREALSAAGFNRWSVWSPSIHYDTHDDHMWGDDIGIDERH